MKKHPILITLSAIVIIFAVAFIVVLNPTVQKLTLLKILGDTPELDIDIDYFKAGFSDTEINEIKIAYKNSQISVKKIEIEYAISPTLFSDKISISKIIFADVLIDLRKEEFSETKATDTSNNIEQTELSNDQKFDFNGLLSLTDIGYQFEIDNVHISGKLLLPDNKNAVFTLTAGNIKPNQTGIVSYNLKYYDINASAPIESITCTGEINLSQNEASGFSNINMTTNLIASRSSVEDAWKLEANLENNKELKKEIYNIKLTKDDHSIAQFDGEFDNALKNFSGKYSIDATDKEMVFFYSEKSIPELSLNGSGNIKFNLNEMTSEINNQFSFEAEQLNSFCPDLNFVKKLACKFESDISTSKTQLVVNKVDLSVTENDQTEIIKLKLNDPLTISCNNNTIPDIKDGQLTLNINALSLDWIDAFIPDYKITGDPLTTNFVLSHKNSVITFGAPQNVAINNINVSQENRKILDSVTLQLNPMLTYQEGKAEAIVDNFKIAIKNQDIATLEFIVSSDSINSDNKSFVATGNAVINFQFLASENLPDNIQSTVKNLDKLTAKFDIQGDENVFKINELLLKIIDKNEKSLVNIKNSKAFSIDYNEIKLVGNNSPIELLKIKINDLPINYLDPLLKDFKLEGDNLNVDLSLQYDEQKFSLTPNKPIQAANISVSNNTQKLINNISFSLEPTIKLSLNNAEIKLNNLNIISSEGTIATGSTEAYVILKPEISPKSLKSKIDVNIAKLIKQPIFEPTNEINEGILTFNTNVSFDNNINAKVNIEVDRLIYADSPEKENNATINISLTQNSNGDVSINAPIELNSIQGTSDLLMSASYKSNNDVQTIKLDVNGNKIFMEDIQNIAGIFTLQSINTPNETISENVSADPIPQYAKHSFWHGYEGEINSNIKEVILPGNYIISDIVQKSIATKDKLTLEKLEAKLGDDPITLTADVIFDNTVINAYSTKGNIVLSDFQAGDFFRKSDPDTLPPFEGDVNLSANFHGSATDIALIHEKLMGDFKLVSKSGIFRMPDDTEPEPQPALSGLGFLGDKLKIKELSSNNLSKSIDKIKSYVENFNYDHFEIIGRRDKSLDYQLTSINLVSPEIYFKGNGKIFYRENVDFKKYKIEFPVLIGGKGEFASELDKINLVSKQQNDLGFFIGPNFTIKGTVGKPSFRELFLKVIGAQLGLNKLNIFQKKNNLVEEEQHIDEGTENKEEDKIDKINNLLNNLPFKLK